jgi:hypothetical protein
MDHSHSTDFLILITFVSVATTLVNIFLILYARQQRRRADVATRLYDSAITRRRTEEEARAEHNASQVVTQNPAAPPLVESQMRALPPIPPIPQIPPIPPMMPLAAIRRVAAASAARLNTDITTRLPCGCSESVRNGEHLRTLCAQHSNGRRDPCTCLDGNFGTACPVHHDAIGRTVDAALADLNTNLNEMFRGMFPNLDLGLPTARNTGMQITTTTRIGSSESLVPPKPEKTPEEPKKTWHDRVLGDDDE